MGIELPLVSIVMGRLTNPEIHLAAYGGIVFPLSLLIEAPIIMILAASTSLSQNRQAYLLLRRFVAYTATCLTGLHVLIAFTPLYDIIVSDILDVPDDIVTSGRDGLQIMTPWTAAIAIRRFQQGVLIRFGKSRIVASGTAVRLATHIGILTTGYFIGTLPGIMVCDERHGNRCHCRGNFYQPISSTHSSSDATPCAQPTQVSNHEHLTTVLYPLGSYTRCSTSWHYRLQAPLSVECQWPSNPCCLARIDGIIIHNSKHGLGIP